MVKVGYSFPEGNVYSDSQKMYGHSKKWKNFSCDNFALLHMTCCAKIQCNVIGYHRVLQCYVVLCSVYLTNKYF